MLFAKGHPVRRTDPGVQPGADGAGISPTIDRHVEGVLRLGALDSPANGLRKAFESLPSRIQPKRPRLPTAVQTSANSPSQCRLLSLSAIAPAGAALGVKGQFHMGADGPVKWHGVHALAHGLDSRRPPLGGGCGALRQLVPEHGLRAEPIGHIEP